MEHARERRLSRWMPAAADRTISPRAFRIGCALISALAAVALYFSTGMRYVLALLAVAAAVISVFHGRRMRRRLAERRGESICTFARALEASFHAWITAHGAAGEILRSRASGCASVNPARALPEEVTSGSGR